MASHELDGPELETDVDYISTPAAQPSTFEGPDCGFPTTKVRDHRAGAISRASPVPAPFPPLPAS